MKSPTFMKAWHEREHVTSLVQRVDGGMERTERKKEEKLASDGIYWQF